MMKKKLLTTASALLLSGTLILTGCSSKSNSESFSSKDYGLKEVNFPLKEENNIKDYDIEFTSSTGGSK